MISFIIGGICGIWLMCLLQINRDNELEQENKRLREEYTLLQNASDEYEDELQVRINKAIDFIKHNAIYEDFNMLGGDCEELIEILGGDVDYE